MKLSTKIVLGLLVVVVGFLTWGYLTSSLPAPFPARHRTSAENISTSGTTDTSQILQYKEGTLFTYGNLQYLVSKTERATEVKQGNTTVKTSGSFILVFVTVKNSSKVPVVLEPSDFALIDAEGRAYSVNLGASNLSSTANEAGDMFGEALQPSLERTGVLVFDIPKDATGLSIRLYNGYLDVALP
jgi:hypothetical protein